MYLIKIINVFFIYTCICFFEKNNENEILANENILHIQLTQEKNVAIQVFFYFGDYNSNHYFAINKNVFIIYDVKFKKIKKIFETRLF